MDRRIARTRRSLGDALVDLLRQNELDELTIADIAEHADVNRSSFYQHYASKDELLAEVIEQMLEGARREVESSVGASLDPAAILTGFFRHIEDNAGIYARLFGAHGSPEAYYRLRTRTEAIVSETITARARSITNVAPEVLAAGIAGAVLGVMGAWLSQDPRPSADVAAGWLWQVVLPPPSP